MATLNLGLKLTNTWTDFKIIDCRLHNNVNVLNGRFQIQICFNSYIDS